MICPGMTTITGQPDIPKINPEDETKTCR